MISYIIRRIIFMFPTLIGIMTICFFISEFVPGGPIDQVRAQLQGEGVGGGEGGEVAGPSKSGPGMNAAKRKTIDPKDEMRLLRQYGYHTTRLERYLRTILWYNPDSIISSKEIDDQEQVYFTSHGRKCIVVRTGDTYQACEAQPYLGEKTVARTGWLSWLPWDKREANLGTEVYYDKENKVLRDVKEGKVTYDLATGKRLTGDGPDLKAFKIDLRPSSRTTRYPLIYEGKGKAMTATTPGTTDPVERPFLEIIGKRPKNLLANALLHEARDKAKEKDGSITINDKGIITIVNTDASQTISTIWNPAAEKLVIRDDYTEAYLQEPWTRAISNWENWHGYFLFKFGRSIHHSKPSYELIKERLPVSIRLGMLSFFITYTGCICLGILKAVKHGKPFDTWSSVLALMGYSIPGFVLAVLLLAQCSQTESALIHIFPTGRIHALPEVYAQLSLWGKIWNNIHHMLAPAICLTIGSFAVLTMFTKNNILNENNQLYAVAARARGLSERKVLFKHILRNAFVPLVTGFPSSFLMMFFGGSLLIEKIFNLNGIGLLGYEAIMGRDFPVVMGNLFMFGALGLFARLLTDICYVIADPRISFDASKA